MSTFNYPVILLILAPAMSLSPLNPYIFIPLHSIDIYINWTFSKKLSAQRHLDS